MLGLTEPGPYGARFPAAAERRLIWMEDDAGGTFGFRPHSFWAPRRVYSSLRIRSGRTATMSRRTWYSGAQGNET